jgi:hypothetical protein
MDLTSVEAGLPPVEAYNKFVSNWTTEVQTVAIELIAMAKNAHALGSNLLCVDFEKSNELD